MEIRKINGADAEMLSELSKAIYKEYYLHLWNTGGADWYQDIYAYHPAKLKAELDDNNNQHFVVFENKEPQGYLKLRINAVLKGIENRNSLEIERIYLHKKIAGKGVGRHLMLLSENIAKEHNKQLIFLKAMDSSADAISFYEKMGYTICGSLVLPFEQMKEEYRGMVILSKKI